MITETERLSLLAKHGTNTSTSDIIRDYIDNHNPQKLLEGKRYYENENDILDRQMYYYDENQAKQVDTDKINNKVPNNWHKLLVDQKVNYLLGKSPVFKSDDDTFTDEINNLLGDDFDDTLRELGKQSSNKGKEWLHIYLNSNGEFSFIRIPAEQVIPIYDTSLEKELKAVIRYYPFVVNGEEVLRAEYWTDKDVSYYIEQNGIFTLEEPREDLPENPASHITYNNKGYGWDRVPFIEFKNNEEGYGDLKFYKALIDQYDKNLSDFCNNTEEVQEIVWALKGYDGENLSTFTNNLKYYKAIKLEAEEKAGVEAITLDIPIEARKELLRQLKENIFMFGQGLDTTTDKFGNSPSGVALKFLYALLDLKCNAMEMKFKKSLKELMWFIAEYLTIKNNPSSNTPIYDYKSVDITFNRTMITNDLEKAQIGQASMGVISKETIVANHPWVTNSQKELERLEKENTSNIDLDNIEDD